ncbi:MAG: TOMM precursor leader peptide-binding protein [Chloroflexi bacterium]|nr:TOMM precursor leader peptide-binding protein [Chloroflexota bacterium]
MRLKRHYSIVAHSPDVVELRHGTWNPISLTLTDSNEGGHLLGVLRRLDGHATTKEIATAEGIPVEDVEALVDQLIEMRVVEEQSSNILDYYLDHLVPNLLPYQQRPHADGRRAAAILCGDPLLTEPIQRTLEACQQGDLYTVGVGDSDLQHLLRSRAAQWLSDPLALHEDSIAFGSWQDHLLIWCSGTVHPLELQALNRLSMLRRFPVLYAAIDGPCLLVGPTVIPGRSACFDCFSARVLMNLREAASYQRYKQALVEGHVYGATPPINTVLAPMLSSLTAFEAVNFLLTGANFTVNKVLSIYLPSFEFTFNEVLRLPTCPSCAPEPERDDRELFFAVQSILTEPNASTSERASHANHHHRSR